jgi:hypothetical protein
MAKQQLCGCCYSMEQMQMLSLLEKQQQSLAALTSCGC